MIEEGIINFESYYFFRRCEVVVGKNIILQTCFLYTLCYSSPFARVQSPTCTNYGKSLLENIMAALNPKSGIKTTTEEICKTDYKGKQILPK